jgi:hypothetical protein
VTPTPTPTATATPGPSAGCPGPNRPFSLHAPETCPQTYPSDRCVLARYEPRGGHFRWETIMDCLNRDAAASSDFCTAVRACGGDPTCLCTNLCVDNPTGCQTPTPTPTVTP